MRFYVIGAGTVGTGLALALRSLGHELVGVWNRGAKNGARAHTLLGIVPEPQPTTLARAELVLVSVSDQAIPELGTWLSGLGQIAPGTVVAHTAGSLPGAALGTIGKSLTASLHPWVACADPEQAAQALRGATFGVEGHETAVTRLTELVASLGGTALRVNSAAKARYHGALVLASNLQVALLEIACREARAAGCDAPDKLAAFARDAVALAVQRGTAAALTGPIVRGDATTVQAHLASLSPDTLPVYRALSRVALELASARGLSRAAVATLQALLAPR